MKRITHIGTCTALAATFSLGLAFAKPGMLGKLGPDEFKKLNADGGASVKAITPDGKKFSESDADLLKEIAAGGMMQLEASKLVVKMASSEDVRIIAQAEVEEQTILGAKLKEIAADGGVTLPSEPGPKTKEAIDELKSKSGLELDKAYLQQSGIEGHEILQATMEKVQAKAEDATLKLIASTTLPLIKSHLDVAKAESSDMN